MMKKNDILNNKMLKILESMLSQIINKDVLIRYFEKNKWYDETLNDSFINDFNNAYLLKNYDYKNIKIKLYNLIKINEIKFFQSKLNTNDEENNIIFIPLYKNNNNFVGVGYLFTNKGIINLDSLEVKTFCKFMITNQELNQMKEILDYDDYKS